jgi:hypothetical protein
MNDPYGIAQCDARTVKGQRCTRTVSRIGATTCAQHAQEADDEARFQDHTDPEYVIGAVLAQVEDLDPMVAVRVLTDALTTVVGRLS